ncbi:10121_t:CDS:2 [Entrophospora sp. SA101]|nr:10121_t:CDS:2 [Entrophospora sp. SA101]
MEALEEYQFGVNATTMKSVTYHPENRYCHSLEFDILYVEKIHMFTTSIVVLQANNNNFRTNCSASPYSTHGDVRFWGFERFGRLRSSL